MARTRRQILGFGAATSGVNIRPPWAKDETQFTDACTRCGDCVEACEERIIVLSGSEFPRIVFGGSKCTFCGACADACPVSAFDTSQLQPWAIKAEIGEDCLVNHNVSCGLCRDRCEQIAIRFYPSGSSHSIPPSVQSDACTGCGECLGFCPVGAISMLDKAPETQHSGATL